MRLKQTSNTIFLHGSSVEQGGQAILFLGAPNSGKTYQSIKYIRHGWRLVADDYVKLEKIEEVIRISPPENMRGLLEWKGNGIVRVPFSEHATLKQIIILDEKTPTDFPQWIQDCVTIHLSSKMDA